jgi:hypothetical protein
MEDPMRTKSTRYTSLRHLITAGALGLVISTPALGQTTTLQTSTIESASLGGSQISQISSFVDHWSSRALESDSQSAMRAQTKLVEPLINPRVSISFRRAYSDALGSYFDQLDTNGDVGSTLSMLRLAGELGTTKSTEILINAMGSDDAGIQIFAIGRAGRTFRTTAVNGPALSVNDLGSLVSKLKEISGASTDPAVLDACLQSYAHGSTLPSGDFLAARADCMKAMCDAASKQLINPGKSDLETRARLAVVGSGAANFSLLQNGEDSTNEAIKSAVALGADMISIALSDILDGTMPGIDDRGLQTSLVRSGESLLYFALKKHAELNGRSPVSVKQTQLAVLLEAGEDRDFRNKAALLLGAGSPIVTTFDFADDRFVH